MHETLNNIQVWGGCRRITITGAHSYHNSTVEKGAGYPADISIRGSQVLVDRCSSHGLGGFYVATLNQAAMLNVVLNCTFEGTGSIQPHMHWSTGLLIDSCTIPDGRIDLIDRKNSGSGHGWAIGWGIVWNGAVKHLQIQMPPGALNLSPTSCSSWRMICATSAGRSRRRSSRRRTSTGCARAAPPSSGRMCNIPCAIRAAAA
jgi:hypothetical protein